MWSLLNKWRIHLQLESISIYSSKNIAELQAIITQCLTSSSNAANLYTRSRGSPALPPCEDATARARAHTHTHTHTHLCLAVIVRRRVRLWRTGNTRYLIRFFLEIYHFFLEILRTFT